MGYNEPDTKCFTPCQIGKINNRLISGTPNAYIESCNGCLPPNAFFVMLKDQCIQQPFWLNGTASFGENKWKIDVCKVAAENSTTCIGSVATSGWKNHEIGKVDIKTVVPNITYVANSWYKITLTVKHTTCDYPSSQTAYFRVFEGVGCTTINPPPGPVSGFMVFPNPTETTTKLSFDAAESGYVTVQLLNLQTNLVEYVIVKDAYCEAGYYEHELNTFDLPKGNYQLQVLFNGAVSYRNLLKL